MVVGCFKNMNRLFNGNILNFFRTMMDLEVKKMEVKKMEVKKMGEVGKRY